MTGQRTESFFLWMLSGFCIQGKRRPLRLDDDLTAMIEAYKVCDNTFVCEALHQSSDENRIVAILMNNLGERSCDIFEFSDGLNVIEYEFIIA